MLNVALPKGRLGEKVYKMLERAGYSCEELMSDTRKLVFTDENSGVRWFTLEESETAPSEAWFCARVYRKLNEKLRAGNLLSPAP